MKKVTFFILLFVVSSVYLYAADPLKEYTGKYKLAAGSAITEVNVVFGNGVLSLTSSMGSTTIEKTTSDTFSIPNYNGTAVFTRNEQKKINGIKIDVMGISLEGVKEEKETIGSGVIPPLPVNQSPFPMKYLPTMLQGDIAE